MVLMHLVKTAENFAKTAKNFAITAKNPQFFVSYLYQNFPAIPAIKFPGLRD